MAAYCRVIASTICGLTTQDRDRDQLRYLYAHIEHGINLICIV